MYLDDVHLHYMYLKIHGKDYRILSTNFPRLQAGNYSSDFFGFFGLGSGEFFTPRIKDLFHPVTTINVKDENIQTALNYWKERPEFMGFVDRRPEQGFYVILNGGSEELHDLPFNWEVYTQLGVPNFAFDTLSTFNRAHIAYPTREEQTSRIQTFLQYIKLF